MGIYVHKPTHTHRFTFLWVFQSSFPRASACQTCCRSLDVKCSAALALPPSQFCSKIKCKNWGSNFAEREGKKRLLTWRKKSLLSRAFCFPLQPSCSNAWLSECFTVDPSTQSHSSCWQAFIKTHNSKFPLLITHKRTHTHTHSGRHTLHKHYVAVRGAELCS